MRRRIAVVAVVGALAASSSAVAETSVQRADRLFREGREHFKDQRYEQACAAFEESQQLDPQVGVLFNLAGCREKTGKLATALELYRELARIDTNEERRKVSERTAAALVPRVPKLVVKVDAQPNLTIAIDGKDTTAMRGLQVPVDLGTHVVVVRAPGFADFTTEVNVREERKIVEVPVTLVAGGAQVQPALPSPSMPGTPIDRPTSSRERNGKIVVAVGGGLFVVGLGFGTAALVRDRELEEAGLTLEEHRNITQRARLYGNVSTITVTLGLVAAGVGTYLWVTGSSRATTTAIVPSVNRDSATVNVLGRF